MASRRRTGTGSSQAERAVANRKSVSTAGSIFAPSTAASSRTRPTTHRSTTGNDSGKTPQVPNITGSDAGMVPSMELDDPTLSYSNRANAVGAGSESDRHVLTLADLDNGTIPPHYQTHTGTDADTDTEGNGNMPAKVNRHIKDEIDELLYQLQVKDKEIRMSRVTVEKELSGAKRSTVKLSRDVDDLMRAQHRQLQKQSQTISLPQTQPQASKLVSV